MKIHVPFFLQYVKLHLSVEMTPTSHAVLSNLPVLHEVHDRQDGGADASWEDSLRRLEHVVSRSVFCCVLFIWQKKDKYELSWA